MGVTTAVSACALTNAACLPSMRVRVASPRLSVRRATVDGGTSVYAGPSSAPGSLPVPPPEGRRMRSLASSIRLLRRSRGYLTITLTSSCPRWIRCTSAPLKLARNCVPTNAGVNPAAFPAGVS